MKYLYLAALVFLFSFALALPAQAVTVSGTCDCIQGSDNIGSSDDISDKATFIGFVNECLDGTPERLITCPSLKMNNIPTVIVGGNPAAVSDLYDQFFTTTQQAEQTGSGVSGGTGSGVSGGTGSGVSGGTPGSGQVVETLPNLLGTSDPNAVFGRIINFIVGMAGSAALLMFIYGGIMWLISRGNPDYIAKGKNAMKYAIFGLVVIFTSYLVIKFIITAVGVIGG